MESDSSAPSKESRDRLVHRSRRSKSLQTKIRNCSTWSTLWGHQSRIRPQRHHPRLGTSKRRAEINSIRAIRGQPKRRPAAKRSLIVFTEDQETANRCLKFGFFIDNFKQRLERYAPQLFITQCYKCHGFGHRATNCPKSHICGHCNHEDHPTSEWVSFDRLVGKKVCVGVPASPDAAGSAYITSDAFDAIVSEVQ